METKINKGAHKKSMMVLQFTLLAGGGYVFGRLVGDLMLGPYVCWIAIVAGVLVLLYSMWIAFKLKV